MTTQDLASTSVSYSVVALVLAGLLIGMGIVLVLISRNIRLTYRLFEANPRTQENLVTSRLSRFIQDISMGINTNLLPRELLLVSVLASVLPFLLLQMIGAHLLEGLIAAAVGFCIVPFIMRLKRKGSLAKFEQQLSNAMPLIATNLRAGLTLRQSLVPVAENMSDPFKTEFTHLAEDVASGISTSRALYALADRMKSEDLRLFATAVSIQETQGGSIAEITERVGQTIRQRMELKLYIKSRTSMADASSLIMTGIPVLVFAVLMVMSETHQEFYTTVTGFITILVCLVMAGTGMFIMKKMAKIG